MTQRDEVILVYSHTPAGGDTPAAQKLLDNLLW